MKTNRYIKCLLYVFIGVFIGSGTLLLVQLNRRLTWLGLLLGTVGWIVGLLGASVTCYFVYGTTKETTGEGEVVGGPAIGTTKKVGWAVLWSIPIMVVVSLLCAVGTASSVQGLGLVWKSGATLHWRNIGGNLSEVYGHFTNLIAMVGLTISIGWFVILQALSMSWGLAGRVGRLRPSVSPLITALLSLVGPAVLAITKDGEAGIAYIMLVPSLVCSASPFMVIHRLSHCAVGKIITALIFMVANIALQISFTPSETGGPDILNLWGASYVVGMGTAFSVWWIQSGAAPQSA